MEEPLHVGTEGTDQVGHNAAGVEETDPTGKSDKEESGATPPVLACTAKAATPKQIQHAGIPG